MTEHVGEITVDGETFDVYAILEDDGQTVDFYDVFDRDGGCVNLGEPLYGYPAEDDIRRLLVALV